MRTADCIACECMWSCWCVCQLAACTSLQVVWAEDNRFKEFPRVSCHHYAPFACAAAHHSCDAQCLLSLTKLRVLRLTGNDITVVPTDIGGLTCLEDLVRTRRLCACCQLRRVHVMERVRCVWCASVPTQALDNNEITGVPSSIGNLVQLKKLLLR